MKIAKFEFNPFAENTYLLWDENTRDAVLIDPGCYTPAEQQQLARFIEKNELKIKHLLATHLHLDHAFGIPWAVRTYGTGLSANPADEFLLQGMEAQATAFGCTLPDQPVPIAHPLDEGDLIHVGNHTLRVLLVPGHSPGSLVFYSPEEKIAIGGDVLFLSSIGRTDLPGGNYKTLVKSIDEKLFTLPDDTRILPGHGPETTVGFERQHNPYL